LVDDITDDAVLGGALRLLQPRSGHRFGHDAILLAAATAAQPGEHVVDLGAGVGVAGLALAKRVTDISLTLVEIDPALCKLAGENAARNGMADRVAVAALDVTASASSFDSENLKAGCADRVLMNPPFHAAARTQSSPDAARRVAHVAQAGSLAVWVGTAARLLRSGGTLTLIYRADGLDEVLAALASGFGPAEVLPVFPKPDAPPIRVIVQASRHKSGHDGLRNEAAARTVPGLYLNGAGGVPTPEAEAILRRLAALEFKK
jgi:tRNA1(Val) A37 N6-methylase TrmN6